jgi:hypothetical protein
MTTDSEIMGDWVMKSLIDVGKYVVSLVESNALLAPHVGNLNLSRDEFLAVGMYVTLIGSLIVLVSVVRIFWPYIEWLMPSPPTKSFKGSGLAFVSYSRSTGEARSLISDLQFGFDQTL